MRQSLLVRSIPWADEPSGQRTVEIETPSGTRFTCFLDGGSVAAGTHAAVEAVDYLDIDWELFPVDAEGVRSMMQRGEWDLEVVAPVVRVDDDAAWIDVCGILLPLYRFTRDPRGVGAWVRVRYTRLEIVLADDAPPAV